MNNPRIIFFGTPEFAVSCLDYLIEKKQNVVAIVTAPDRIAGRGKKTTPPAMKRYAVSKAIKIFQPENLKSNTWVSELTKLKPDLFIVVAFRMLPKIVWAIPPLGTFNLHASLLPDYRGAAPINWAIINGETKTGVSTFLIDESIDTGMLLLQEEIAISPEDNAGTIHDKLIEVGAPLILKTIEGLWDKSLIPKPQNPNGKEHLAPKLNAENTKISWDKTPNVILNHIRGLNPYPGAWTYFMNNNQKKRMKIFSAAFLKTEHQYPLNAIVVTDKKLLVATKGGFIFCKEIQLPNKKRMESKALLNGYTFTVGAKML